jgi:hypothetical protein
MKPIDRPHELKRYYQDTGVAEDEWNAPGGRLRIGQ